MLGPKCQTVFAKLITTLTPSSTSTPINGTDSGGSVSNNNIAPWHDSAAVVSSFTTELGALAVTRHFETKGVVLSAGQWADNMINISVGDLRSESTHTMDINNAQFLELLEEDKLKTVTPTCGGMMDDHQGPENSSDYSGGLTEMYWADSLGSLDLDIPFCRYKSNDIILSDGLCCLNCLIANSMDAFQSCSSFGLDKKEPASTDAVSKSVVKFRRWYHQCVVV